MGTKTSFDLVHLGQKLIICQGERYIIGGHPFRLQKKLKSRETYGLIEKNMPNKGLSFSGSIEVGKRVRERL